MAIGIEGLQPPALPQTMLVFEKIYRWLNFPAPWQQQYLQGVFKSDATGENLTTAVMCRNMQHANNPQGQIGLAIHAQVYRLAFQHTEVVTRV
jgi:hypothetical protein